MGKGESFIKWFSELSNKDINIAGGKGASLAEMYNNKFPVPPGFIITAEAYRHFIEKSGVANSIKTILDETDVDNTTLLDKNAEKIRNLIEHAQMPQEMKHEIIEAYEVLDIDKAKFSGAHGGALDILKNSHEPPFVAVRSSATTEDLADASFAGQQETFLNVKGNEHLILSVKKCFASLFTARAVYYRKKKGFDHEKSYLAVVIQKMIDSQKSGVIFSQNPVTDEKTIVIESVYGLGEGIVSGMILPDHYVLSRSFEIIDRKIGDKKIALTRSASGRTEKVSLNAEISSREVLTGHELKVLAQYALRLEEHYGKPQDIEFAIDKEGIYIVQSRPITTKAVKSNKELGGNVLLSGLPASPGVASGVVIIVKDMVDLNKVQKGNILVTAMTNPDMVVSMQRAAGIITDEGGLTSHASIVSREMGIPAVVGTKYATQRLTDGAIVTVDGFTGRVIEGKGVEKKVEIKKIVPTKTKIKVIVDLPDYASRAAECGAKGVGLVRLEAVIATEGKHPIWYVKKDKLKDYISSVYKNLKKISLPFDNIWVRTTDIRSDEYKNLEGAPQNSEMNPMLGDHGIRFSLKNIDLLESEIKAIKELADEYGNKNFGIMLPQVISAMEVRETKKIAEKISLPENVKFGIMVETPAAVQIIEDLCKEKIDFISFGTNDLTQYTLALDRNNEDVQDLYDEMNPAVLNSMAHVIKICKKYGVETSICGAAASRIEMAKFLVEHGIDSLSVNADSAYEISKVIAEMEEKTRHFRKHSTAEENAEVIFGGSRGPQESLKIENHGIAIAMKYQKTPEQITDEELILQELDGNKHEEIKETPQVFDEYNPGLDGVEDIPSLNEAIPVSSQDFAAKSTKENILEITSNEEVFEKLQGDVFDMVVKQEVEENMPPQQLEYGQDVQEGHNHKKEQRQPDEVSDLF